METIAVMSGLMCVGCCTSGSKRAKGAATRNLGVTHTDQWFIAVARDSAAGKGAGEHPQWLVDQGRTPFEQRVGGPRARVGRGGVLRIAAEALQATGTAGGPCAYQGQALELRRSALCRNLVTLAAGIAKLVQWSAQAIVQHVSGGGLPRDEAGRRREADKDVSVTIISLKGLLGGVRHWHPTAGAAGAVADMGAIGEQFLVSHAPKRPQRAMGPTICCSCCASPPRGAASSPGAVRRARQPACRRADPGAFTPPLPRAAAEPRPGVAGR
ncbi:hypothetical protein OPT61_g10068 [Boeremia exigua]|uniref:Uncharacterized protein n=1 Tax=Boeremia exigua TaxID=749465 RepID=A0ACC2HRW4_9PLEO|nr:hypothetical protein OPT61_g10068 [Boeremia exigua]